MKRFQKILKFVVISGILVVMLSLYSTHSSAFALDPIQDLRTESTQDADWLKQSIAVLKSSRISNLPLSSSWSDNFDSYATGSSMHGQGGWKGWANDPSATAYTTDVQAKSTPNSVNISAASDLVHEYSGYTSEKWIYTAWQFIPTDFTGESYFILLNQYDDAMTTLNWSTQVSFNGATNQVFNTGISLGTLPLIKGQWVELRVEIDLTNDTQSFYYNSQLLYAGTWTDEVSGLGIANIGAVDLFANNASTVYYDNISLKPEPKLIYLPVILK